MFNFLASAILAISTSCTSSEGGSPDAPSTLTNAFDVPIDGLSAGDVARFDEGDAKFGVPFRGPDGLGPLFIRSACSACHVEGARGPGLVQKMVVVESDGLTPSSDQSALAWGHTIREGLEGATTAIEPPPSDQLPPETSVRVSIRLGPPVLGRGYIEAIEDAEIERIEAAQSQRGDAITGRIHRVTFTSVPNPDATFGAYTQGQTGLIGRFGMKARIATVDDFTADAFQGDMGLTTPMRPVELPNPDGMTDDARTGVDLPIDRVDVIAFYLRHIAIPHRVDQTPEGTRLFEQTQCAACHVPSLHTRADYPIAPLANIDAPIYSDLLLHDMGDALSDSLVEGDASGREWKTTPLIGLRFFPTFLHDGRASSVEDAILAHDGEARDAADRFRALSASDRALLVRFVEGL